MQYPTSFYFDLEVPAKQRLAMMRRAFETHATDYPHCPEHAKPKSWRDLRGTTHKSVQAYCGSLHQGFNGEGLGRTPVWYSMSKGNNFRDEHAVHEGNRNHRINHKGWYTEFDGTTYKDGTGLCWGIVGRLPHGRFIAGYELGGTEKVYFPTVYDDEDEAVSAADEHARVQAELCQEDSAEQEALREAEDLVTDLSTELAEQRLRIKEAAALRHNPAFPYMAERLKELCEDCRDIKDKLAKARKELADLED